MQTKSIRLLREHIINAVTIPAGRVVHTLPAGEADRLIKLKVAEPFGATGKTILPKAEKTPSGKTTDTETKE